MKKRVLKIQAMIIFDVEPEESLDDAENRFLGIMDGVGFVVPTCTSTLVEIEEDDV